jgi:teichoic acid transport system permease protein
MLEAVKFVCKEHFDNIPLIIKMSLVSMRKQTLRTSLGVLWLYIHDFVYFFVFLLFRILMAGKGQIDGINNVVFLITGLIPWFFISEVLGVVSCSIKSSKSIITSIKFPVSVLPTIELIGIFLKRIWTFLFIFAVAIFYGYLSNINLFLVLYYTFAMLILMFVIMLPITAFIAVSSDFQQLYLVVIRVFLYTMPIVWGFKHIKEYTTLCKVVKLNPMVYILNGYRSAFVYGNMPSLIYTVYFWVFILIFFVLGCFVQYKLKRYYSDFM